MSDPTALPDRVRCPRCRGGLVGAPGGLRCRDCGGSSSDAARSPDPTGAGFYPICAGIPWLYRDVAGSRGQWAAKLQRLRSEILADLQSLDAALTPGTGGDAPLPATRTRLESQRSGVERLGRQLFELLEPFGFSHSEAGAGLPRDRIPSRQHLGSYLETAFRDWCWGGNEVHAALDLVWPLLGAEPAGRHVLVLGGGAGRLTYELACLGPFASVVQLDLNPLLTRIAARVVAGEPVTLTELPRLPLGVEHAAVDQRLARPGLAPVASIHWLLGDVFAPPLAEASFDVIVTPWLVDVLPESFRQLARRFAALLAPGGRWIDFGPLSFESLPPADRFTREEVEQALADAGLEVEHSAIHCVPYLHSPHGMTRRHEEILVFQATRRGEVPAPRPFAYYPDWMTDPSLPVPALPAFEPLRNERILDAEILKCIDGTRSVDAIVEALSRRYELPEDRCRNAVNRFFARWHETEASGDGRIEA